MMLSLQEDNIELQIVYKVVNRVNQRYYIGSTGDKKERFMRHKTDFLHKMQPDNELYQDMVEYGLDKFDFLVISEMDSVVESSRLESSLIRENKGDPLMYNRSFGASGRRVFENSDIIFIRNLYQEKELYIVEAYKKYYNGVVSFRAFKKVWHGETFKSIHYHVYSSENKSFHFSLGQSRRGETNRSAVYSEKDVKEIRIRQKNGEDKKLVKQSYKHLTHRMVLMGFGTGQIGNILKYSIILR